LLQVVELLLHIFKIYMTILKTVVSGLLQILWNVARVMMWMIAAAGSSPRRKFSKEEVEVWYRRSVAELKKSSEGLILEDDQWCDIGWPY
jgi:hypothetical protein